jgi:glycosyltransferase involved in cell wall biosynthesis
MLREALHSALGQDLEAEVIVVENGSTDGTVEYLRALSHPNLTPLIFEQPLGATAARNEGLRAAQGEWVAFLDDDDLWAPTKLSSQIEAASRAGRSWAYTGAVYIDGDCQVTGGREPPTPEQALQQLPQRYSIPAGISSMLWRRESLDQAGLLESSLTYMVDWDLAQRLARTGPPAAVAEPLVAYRQHGANMSVRAHRYLEEMAVVDAKFADLRRGRPLDFAYQHRNAGSEFLRTGKRREALRCYWRAARLGDRGALVRASAALMPRSLWPALRRRVLSDESWLSRAEPWLHDHRAAEPHAARQIKAAA